MIAKIPFVCGLMISMFLVGTAQADTLEVNSLADTVADDGECTLREAITSANTDLASGAQSGECAAGSGSFSRKLRGDQYHRNCACAQRQPIHVPA